MRPWIAAMRPATLLAGAVPVAVGAALAMDQPHFHWGFAGLCLLGSLLIQIATNFANDYYDFMKGADTEERVGPERATQQGWISPQAMKRATVLVLLLALGVGVLLIQRGGWPIAGLGACSLLLAIGYTGGPFPLAYLGLGDVFVLLFFGLGATVGSYWILALTTTPGVWAAGTCLGALATAILVVNNLRDRFTDAKVGKNTLAVRFGPGFVRMEYAVLVISAFVIVGVAVQQNWLPLGALWVFACFPQAVLAIRAVNRSDGAALNPLLGLSARFEALFAFLLIVGVVAS
jgi:1,4-dihydroxy-2-naphthoate octaprenyltransferase